jgi:hypothetical protein
VVQSWNLRGGTKENHENLRIAGLLGMDMKYRQYNIIYHNNHRPIMPLANPVSFSLSLNILINKTFPNTHASLRDKGQDPYPYKYIYLFVMYVAKLSVTQTM